jgi:OTU-like cysteine protease
VDVDADGNCFYRAVALLVTGSQSSHTSVRQQVADLIESRGSILQGLVNTNNVEFKNYILALRTPGNFDHVEEDTIMAAAEIYSREVYVYTALAEPLIYSPNNNSIQHQPRRLAFYEPAHYKALVPATSSSNLLISPSNVQINAGNV